MSLHLNSFDKGLLKQRLFIVAGSIVAIAAMAYGIVSLLGNASGAASSYWQFNQLTTSGSRAWTTLDASADGVKIVAALGSGNIYTSADSGATWTARTSAGSRTWKSVASSYDGTRLVAATVTGNIYTSADSGATWTARTSAGSRTWADVDISGDGMKLIAAVTGTSGVRPVFTSVDAGVTWVQVSNLSAAANWKAVAISGDGNSIAAANSAGYFNGTVVLSRNGGTSWETGFGYRDWTSIAFSNNGDQFVAVSHDDQMFVYRKDDADPWDITNFNGDTVAVALSGDGTTIAVARPNGEISISADYGLTWSDQSAAGTKTWTDVALTTNGKRLTASASSDYVYAGSIVLSANAPTNLAAVASSGQVALTWTTPTNNGGTPITDYRVEYSSDGGSQWNDFSHSASTTPAQTVTGLTDGYEYIFRVSAVNIAGNGDKSNIVTARPVSGSMTTGPSQSITVTTTDDEDDGSLSQSGCSLREAIIASNTASAYNGCAAGGGVNDIISLPAGTYGYSGSGPYDLYVYGATIVGQNKDTTIINSLSFTFASSAATGIKNVSMVSNGPPTNITILGSNKTIENVHVSGNVPPAILMGNDALTINGTTISNYSTDAAMSSVAIQCLKVCNGTTLEDSEISSAGSTSINVGDEAIVTNTVLSAQSNIDLRVGEDSAVSDVNMTGIGANSTYISLTTGSGSIVEDTAQTNGSSMYINGTAARFTNVSQDGNSSSNYFAADVVDGFTMNMASNLSFMNTAVGSEIKNLSLEVASGGVSLSVAPSLLEDVTINANNMGGVNLDIDAQPSALIKNISINDVSDFSGSIDGDEVTIQGFSAENSDNDNLNITGDNPMLSDFNLKNVSLSLQNTGSPVLERISTDGGYNYSSAINITGDNDDIVIRDSFINNPSHTGIEVSINAAAGTSLLIENTQIQNVTDLNGARGSITTYGVGEVTLDKVTVDNSQQQYYTTVLLQGGSKYTIVNTTVSNSNGGIAIQGEGASEATVNNSTIVNNTAVDLAPWISGGVSFTSYSSQPFNASVKNSIVAGNEGAQCAADSGATDLHFVAENNVSSDATCGNGVVISDVDEVIVNTLSTNSSAARSIGFNGQSGKVKTYALQPDSAALLGGGALSCAPYDARGLQRDVSAGCDIGAYQMNIVIPPPVIPGSGNSGGSGSSQPPAQSTQKPETPAKPRSSSVVAVSGGEDTSESTPTTETENTSPSPTDEEDKTPVTTDTDEQVQGSTSFIPWVIGGLAVVVLAIGAAVLIRRSSRI